MLLQMCLQISRTPNFELFFREKGVAYTLLFTVFLSCNLHINSRSNSVDPHFNDGHFETSFDSLLLNYVDFPLFFNREMSLSLIFFKSSHFNPTIESS